ncbi:MAG: AAA family ATPase [Candidatus Pacearchaeota archaeon]|nr:AAA family ATPase [Candidatus Pacearchaeota archaeon]
MIIGITGTLGAGKGTVVGYLLEKGFKHLSVSKFLTGEIKKRGIEVNRNSMVRVANELRKKNSPSYLAEKLYEESLKQKGDYVLESLRNAGEIEFLRRRGNFHLISVDANPETRYKRISKRKSEKDRVTYEEFLRNEEREMNPVNYYEIDLSGCMRMADFHIENNGKISGLTKKVEEIYREICKRQHNNSYKLISL